MENDTETRHEARDVCLVEPAVNEDGVDLSLIRRSLDMTTAERLALVQGWARAILRARVIGERP